jgi:hypothetical protein
MQKAKTDATEWREDLTNQGAWQTSANLLSPSSNALTRFRPTFGLTSTRSVHSGCT